MAASKESNSVCLYNLQLSPAMFFLFYIFYIFIQFLCNVRETKQMQLCSSS